jgi:hypothetical protein
MYRVKGLEERVGPERKVTLLRFSRRSLMTKDLLYGILAMIESLFYPGKRPAAV